MERSFFYPIKGAFINSKCSIKRMHAASAQLGCTQPIADSLTQKRKNQTYWHQ
uniref:Uncharacterized protein n=1 Tax=Triticum urartu TaxID=4572 RepID=A0A8R7QBX3_TRIUA